MKTLKLSIFLFATLSVGYGSLLYDNYDAEALGTGAPTDTYTFGALITDIGITDAFSVSPDQSTYIVMDFSVAGWGAAMVRGTSPLDVTGGSLSVELRSTFDFTNGLVAFRMTDGDGSIYRTENADFFMPSSSFDTFTQSVNDVTFIDAAGSTAGLDLSNITEVGFIIYDTGETPNTVTFHADDLRVIPEPSTMILLLISFGVLAVFKNKRR